MVFCDCSIAHRIIIGRTNGIAMSRRGLCSVVSHKSDFGYQEIRQLEL